MIGFIGAGNMASALIRGMIKGGADPKELAAHDRTARQLEKLSDTEIHLYDTMQEMLQKVSILVIAVKPKDCAAALETIVSQKWQGALVSIAAGWTQKQIEVQIAGSSIKEVACVMPNTPALVGEGVIACNDNHTLSIDTLKAFTEYFSFCGEVIFVPENLFHAVIGTSGSGPAYMYILMEAMADAAVREGLPREMAYKMAAQTMKGAAEMVLISGQHPAALKDAVCSPAGTTIEAVAMLEKTGLRSAVMVAVRACAQKAQAMTNGQKG